jgi:hypothetical protein
MTVIAMWAHSRSASTAFVRMMIERGDVTVLHEPLLALHEEGRVALPGGGTARSADELLEELLRLGADRSVFLKEVVDYEYAYPEERLGKLTHTFLVRHPRRTIASHYAAKPTVTSPEIGYERLWELFELAWKTAGRKPLVITAEALLADPAGVTEAYCAYAGLPYRPEALAWQPQDRPEWHRHRAWHLDAIASAGFQDRANDYEHTVENHPVLRSYYDHHLPFYEQLVHHALGEPQ